MVKPAMKAKPRPQLKEPVERMKGETVAPIKTLQLMSVMGVSRTSRELGVSTTTLHKARKHNLVSRVIEVAADGKLREISGSANNANPSAPQHEAKAAFLLEVDSSKRSLVEQFAAMLGGKLIAA